MGPGLYLLSPMPCEPQKLVKFEEETQFSVNLCPPTSLLGFCVLGMIILFSISWEHFFKCFSVLPHTLLSKKSWSVWGRVSSITQLVPIHCLEGWSWGDLQWALQAKWQWLSAGRAQWLWPNPEYVLRVEPPGFPHRLVWVWEMKRSQESLDSFYSLRNWKNRAVINSDWEGCRYSWRWKKTSSVSTPQMSIRCPRGNVK